MSKADNGKRRTDNWKLTTTKPHSHDKRTDNISDTDNIARDTDGCGGDHDPQERGGLRQPVSRRGQRPRLLRPQHNREKTVPQEQSRCRRTPHLPAPIQTTEVSQKSEAVSR